MRVSLIIPAYNEEARLEPFLQSVADYAGKHQNELQEVILVDDGSKDATVKIAQKYLSLIPGFKIVQLPINEGKGAAVRAGVLVAVGDAVVFMDADGATDVTQLPQMIENLHQADVAIGNRWMPGARTRRHSLVRRFAGYINRRYMAFFGLGSIDTMCGFKGYKRPVAVALFSNLLEKRWLFDTEVAYKAVQARYHIINFPITWESKDGSKLSLQTQLKAAFRIWPLVKRLKHHSS